MSAKVHTSVQLALSFPAVILCNEHAVQIVQESKHQIPEDSVTIN